MASLDLVSPYLFRYKGKNFVVQEGKTPKELDELLHLEVRPTDVYIVAFPKSGTLWMQQILVQIMDEAHPEGAEDETNRNRVPWMEGGVIDNCERERSDPRLNRTHLPPDMLPRGVKEKQVKTIYLMRNPKDILVSLYHFSASWVMLETPTSFNQFFDDFMDSKTFMGSWFDHVREYYNEKEKMNLHFVMFEDMLKDPKGEVEKICKFLEEDLSDEAIDRVVELSTFKNMKTNPKANFKDLMETGRYRKDKPTMRSGKAGDWKNYFTVAQNEHFDRVFKEKMEGIPLSITWEVKQYKGKNFPVQDGKMPKDLDELLHLEVRPTDVYIVTFPKSGSAWMQQILVQIMDEAHPDQVEDKTNRYRVPWIEGGVLDDCERHRPDPRLCGTHLTPDMLPLGVKEKQVKTIYVLRNPKDVLVSLYHFATSWVMLETRTSFNQFFDDFMDGKVYIGSWFDHVREYYDEKENMTLHFVMFEDMLKDLKGEVEKICKFLEEDLSDEAINRVVESSTFKNMKTNPKANYKDLVETQRYNKDYPTMRKGKAGDWKNYVTVAQNEHFDRVFKEKMEGIPLSITWEVKFSQM